jgi:CRP-like cAMP-binding protein
MHTPIRANFFAVQAADQLLAGIGNKGRRELFKLKKPISLEPGTFLVHSGEKPDRIYIHRSGIIQTIPVNSPDKWSEAKEPDSEGVFGLAETLSGAGFDFSVLSVTRSEFDAIDKEDLFEFLRHRPELILKLNAAFSALYRNAVRKIREQ